jgi:hypothetical protein
LVIAVLLIGATACSDDGGDAAETTTAAPSTSVATTGPSSSSSSATTDGSTTTTTEPDPALVLDSAAGDDGAAYSLDWSKLQYDALFVYDDESNPDDPFFHLHNQPEEGFFFSLEMYTTGFGEGWTGQTGRFVMSCTGAGSGICIHFDPDGEGDEHGDLGADFAAGGAIDIVQLDTEGYDLTLTDVVFSDGTTIPGPTRLTGDATEPAD